MWVPLKMYYCKLVLKKLISQVKSYVWFADLEKEKKKRSYFTIVFFNTTFEITNFENRLQTQPKRKESDSQKRYYYFHPIFFSYLLFCFFSLLAKQR